MTLVVDEESSFLFFSFYFFSFFLFLIILINSKIIYKKY